MTEKANSVGVSPGWRKAFYGLLALFVALVLLTGYTILDQTVTISYMQEGIKTTKADLFMLALLAPSLKKGMSQKDVLSLLRQQNPKELISEKNGVIEIGQLVFKFGPDGQLNSVTVR